MALRPDPQTPPESPGRAHSPAAAPALRRGPGGRRGPASARDQPERVLPRTPAALEAVTRCSGSGGSQGRRPRRWPRVRAATRRPEATCRRSSPASSGASARSPRSRDLLADGAPGDADRGRRLWQDPPGARGRASGLRGEPTRTASGWSSWRRWPTRRWCRRRSPSRSACASSPGGRSRTALARLPARPAPAAGPGQLRAPARRLRAAGRGAAARLPARCASWPPAASRWASPARSPGACRPSALPDRGRLPAGRTTPSRRCRGGAALRRAGAGGCGPASP